MGFRYSVSLLPAVQATGLLIVALTGLTPAEHTSLCWTHNRACGFLPLQAGLTDVLHTKACAFFQGAVVGILNRP